MDPHDLVGGWQLQRRLADRLTGTLGRVEGTLTIEDAGDGLRWFEAGVLLWDGLRLDVSREYGLRPGPDGWWMTFADGRPFHPWTPGEHVTHPCAQDLYRGLVDVRPDAIRTLWDVTGPAKSQRIITRLRRVSG